MADLAALQRIAETDFADVVAGTRIVDAKLRVMVTDGSYLDFWWSLEIPGRFAHHWERRHLDGTMYRHDNMPHSKWASTPTFPQHYHDGSSDRVDESLLSVHPETALREFLESVRRYIAT
jgi:Family of unknown function (DUF6516)